VNRKRRAYLVFVAGLLALVVVSLLTLPTTTHPRPAPPSASSILQMSVEQLMDVPVQDGVDRRR
jgi:hypothetical protein